MPTAATFWLCAFLVMALAFANRLLPRTRFAHFSKAVNVLSFAIGAVLLAMFIFGFIAFAIVGFPE